MPLSPSAAAAAELDSLAERATPFRLTLRSLPFSFLGLVLVQGVILRLVLWAVFGTRAGVAFYLLPGILAEGILRDVVVATCLTLPLSLYLALWPRKALAWRVQTWGLALLAFLVTYGYLYIGFVEYFFFDEFDSRLDLVAVDYLIYPHEVLINIWQSYPVLPVLIVVGVATALLVKVFWRRLRDGFAAEQQRSAWRRALRLAVHLGIVVGVAMLPFHFSESAGFENRVAGQVAENGLMSFWRALNTSEIDYPSHYRTLEPQTAKLRARAWLDPTDRQWVSGPDGNDGVKRVFTAPAETPPRTPNVVVVLEESFGAEFVGAYGDPRGLTPHFDALAKKGLLFRNTFASGTRTVRGIEAVVTSFPPIPTVSIVKRPGCEGVANWGAVMRDLGYQTVFLYGGYGYFDNMNHFFSSNGYDVIDRADMPEPNFANIWGMSDEDLFRNAVDELDRRITGDKPVFAVVLSTSNHKPFTFPTGVPDVPPEGGGRLAGVRYADYAIGRLFEMADEHPWSKDTLFVVVADHGARVYGAAEMPLHSYEIPLLMVWPNGIEPGVVERPMGQIDIAPTALGLMGQTYEAPFFGRDVLHADPEEPSYLFFNHNHDVALVRDRDLVIFGLQKNVDVFHWTPPEGFDREPSQRELVDLGTALYQTADNLFHKHLYR